MSNSVGRGARGLGLLLAALVAAVGCDKGMPTVTGKVTLDGQPVANGTIRFAPTDGATASAEGIIKDGLYSVQMPPGPKRVQISAMKVVGKRQVYQGDPNSPVADDVREMIPPKYNASSTLAAEVKGKTTTKDFELKSGP